MTYFFLQVIVVVYDDARPSKYGTCTVTVPVIRNPSGPIFSLKDYNGTFNEREPLGAIVGKVTAVDPDGVSTNFVCCRKKKLLKEYRCHL